MLNPQAPPLRRLPIASVAALLAVVAFVPALHADETTVPVPDSITTRHVPALPESLARTLAAYGEVRGASFQDWHPSERRMLITTRFGEVSQVHEVAMPMGARTQQTFFSERVAGPRYRPNAPAQIVFSFDEGGAENFQLFLLDRAAGGAPRRLTDGSSRTTSALWSPDGARLVYSSTARNGRDYDLYLSDPSQPGSERRLAELSGQWQAADWSADGGKLLVQEYLSANESYLWSFDPTTGAKTAITPRGEGPTVSYGRARWSAKGDAVMATTDRDGEFHTLVRIDPATGEHQPLTPDLGWDVGSFDLSDDGALAVFTVNVDGIERLHLLDLATGTLRPGPDLPPGVLSPPQFRKGSHEFSFGLSWARSSQDVWSFDADRGTLERWTASEAGGLPVDRLPVPELVRYPTFDESAPGVRRTIPAFVTTPDPARFPPPWPVYVDIHGGPEGQTTPGFDGSRSLLAQEFGIVHIAPNVRGSSGYGKSYLLLDNGMKREDSVQDVGALLDWIATRPEFDARRVMVGGGSYGGYMVLASMTLFGERLRCGFDYVGISNFVTFLTNTQEYRRDLRRAEYGDERDPAMRAHLERISPANRVARLTRPMLVAQGANDPRVPLSESDQIVAALEKQGTPVWYVVAADEGHGFAKKSNADYLRVVWAEFLKRCLVGDGFAKPAG